MKKYSVLILYPQDVASEYGETYYAFVSAPSRRLAVQAAKKECIDANEIEGQSEFDEDDLREILVLDGHRDAI